MPGIYTIYLVQEGHQLDVKCLKVTFSANMKYPSILASDGDHHDVDYYDHDNDGGGGGDDHDDDGEDY